MSVATETDKHNSIVDLIEKIKDGDAQEKVMVMLNDGTERNCEILDIGLNHLYISQGSSPTGQKIELDSVVGIDWIEKTNQHLDLSE